MAGSTAPALPSASRPRFRWRRWLYTLFAIFVGLPSALILALFPWDTDRPLTAEEVEKNRRYYAEAYQRPADAQPDSEYEAKYTRIARTAAKQERIEERVAGFVREHHLEEQPVLEVGSGRGYLQDVARNYTGLDISATVAGLYHKKFVLGSATAMPFPDNSFAGGWSIWVLEHVPNPEQALRELRRVMRDGAVLFLLPAWNVTPYAANGYFTRPASDFGIWGKAVKASIPVRLSPYFWVLEHVPARMLRGLVARTGETTLHYRRLDANFTTYWGPDSDAINSLDRHEMYLWFRSRGDECLNCAGTAGSVMMTGPELVIRIRK